jgi:hypothetical protein
MVDYYTFTGEVGQQLFYDALGGNYFAIELYNPAGQKVYSADSRNDRGPDNGLTLLMNGTYRLTVGAGTGSYQFRLSNKSEVSSIVLNTTTSGTLTDSSREADLYKFTGVAGQSIYLNNFGGGYYNSWLLYGPNGQYINSGT